MYMYSVGGERGRVVVNKEREDRDRKEWQKRD